MPPSLHINYLAVALAALAAFAIGALWYAPLFGKPWRKEMGVPEGAPPSGKDMARSFGLNILGLLLMAFVLAHDVKIWMPSTWDRPGDQALYTYGFFAALFIWLGYIVPMLLNAVAFEKKSWKLFAINGGYQFVSLLAMGMILAYLR